MIAAKPGPRRLTANMEDYLEAIYRLSLADGHGRVSRIAEAIGVKKPSVSKALKRLQNEGFVTHSHYGGATVTARGKAVAEAQVRSHRALTRFLEEVLALSPELAEHDACLMEHAISHATVERLATFMDFLDEHGGGAVTKFRKRFERGRQPAAARTSAPRAWTSKV